MQIKQIFKKIIERPKDWQYYSTEINISNLNNSDDCKKFIEKQINISEKSDTELFNSIEKLSKTSPGRLSHIVSTFFLGLWFFNHKQTTFLRKAIMNEFAKLDIFTNTQDFEHQFKYIWFMATLFHDLGYPAEESEGEKLKSRIPSTKLSVPPFYNDVYFDYYKYREYKEHGIYAGIQFYLNMCNIRQEKEKVGNTNLYWRKELDELYQYVAWTIISHNIWFINDTLDNRRNGKVQQYKDNNLDPLIISNFNESPDYKIKFHEYPFFVFFCIIDTIEPLKSSNCLSNIDIQLKKEKIIIKSNDKNYCEKILKLNEWLTPTEYKNGEVVISLEI